MATVQAIKIPDIGGATKVDVIEIMVKEGESIEVDTPLVTLESDKASMEIPSPMAGIVQSIKLHLGDKVAEGDVILMLEAQATEAVITPEVAEISKAPEMAEIHVATEEPKVLHEAEVSSTEVLAGPAARRLAHLLGVSLSDVSGSGRKSRISKEDVAAYVKHQWQAEVAGGSFVSVAPAIDFSQWGAIETKPLSKIKKITGQNMHRAWTSIPHVTQFDEADVTDLEAFRKDYIQNNPSDDVKLTMLAFVCKVVAQALVVYPQFNSSLSAQGTELIYKHYVNIGVAVDTPQGLVVPVIKNVNQCSLRDIASEMQRLSRKAREKGLMPADMSGGCFTISSLGGIGGTAFTPIVNAPEVAILGLSRSMMKPVYKNGTFEPRLMLPLSLSYDHRVIDGAEAARFMVYLSQALADLRRILL